MSAKKIRLLLVLSLTANLSFFSQNSLLWEISGNGLKKTSYLFGTYHLITSTFIDSFPLIHQEYSKTDAVAGEMILDAACLQKVQASAVMKDSSLDQLLCKADYQLVADYLKETSGMSLSLFNKMKPVVVGTLFYSSLLTSKEKGVEMDQYFQESAKTDNKKLIGLETVEDQIAVLFEGTSLKRQAEMLVKSAKDRDATGPELMRTTHCYRTGDLACLLASLQAEDGYTTDEMNRLLYSRNLNWMKKMPGLMEEMSVFIAVGAGHLPGDGGLIDLLRKKGYTLTPLQLK